MSPPSNAAHLAPDAEAAQPAMVSPCRGICVMGGDGFCTGCARTLGEIGAWMMLPMRERLLIMEKLPARGGAPASDSPP